MPHGVDRGQNGELLDVLPELDLIVRGIFSQTNIVQNTISIPERVPRQ